MSRVEVLKGRGFKPSDRFDPTKREVLTSLSKKVLHLVRTFTLTFPLFSFSFHIPFPSEFTFCEL